MRLIDADQLLDFIKFDEKVIAPEEHTAEDIVMMIQTVPTILALPNDPLTLDELREMDGELVYMTDLTGGTLWNQWIIFKASVDGGFIPRGGGWFGVENYGKTWLAYRRRPEEA